MRSRSFASLAMITGLATALLSLFLATQEGAASTHMPPTSTAGHWANIVPSDLQGNIPAIIDDSAMHHFAGIYGGLIEVDNGRHIDIYLTVLRPSVEAALRQLAPHGDLTFLRTPYSLRHVNGIHQRLVARSEQLIRSGIKLTEWWPQIQTVNGAQRLLSAAHCFPGGDSIYNYNVITGAGNQGFIGTVGTRLTTAGSTDAEAINTRSTGKVWTGVPTNPVLTNIAGTATNPVGGTVYNDGAYSGETEGLTINQNNECITPAGFREICHVVHAVATLAGEIANQEGDSGGPIIQIINGSTYAAGIDSASTTALTTPCRYNTPDTCFTDVYYSDIGSVLSELKASIIKS